MVLVKAQTAKKVSKLFMSQVNLQIKPLQTHQDQ